MSDIDAAAAVGAQRVQSEVDMAVMVKAREQFKDRAEAVAGLLESALELAQRIQPSEPGVGESVNFVA